MQDSILPAYEAAQSATAFATSSVDALPPSQGRGHLAAAIGHARFNLT
jgi:hypothetical protein